MEEKKRIFDWSLLRSILITIAVALVIRAYFFTPVLVEGKSMEPTLHNREKIIVSKMISWIGEVDRGDIVIIKDEPLKTHYVKRIIGLPGEVIEMKDDVLWIDGEEIKEPYLEENKKIENDMGRNLTEDFGPIIVPEGHYFVMGDNRRHSVDSRVSFSSLGFIESDRIIGKSKFVLFPIKNMRFTD